MINQFSRFLILVIAFVWPEFMATAESDWELQRDRDGIQVYTRNVAGSPYDEVRAVTEVTGATLSSLVALIEDAEACADWADRCAESYVVERVAADESFIYTHNDMPFPVKDRDVVAHVKWEQDPDTLAVTMSSTAVAGKKEEVKGRLRLTDARASWRFEPLDETRIRISNQAHIDPGSSLPGWVTNMLLVDTPFETMKSFVTEIQKPRYRDAQISFIENR